MRFAQVGATLGMNRGRLVRRGRDSEWEARSGKARSIAQQRYNYYLLRVHVFCGHSASSERGSRARNGAKGHEKARAVAVDALGRAAQTVMTSIRTAQEIVESAIDDEECLV